MPYFIFFHKNILKSLFLMKKILSLPVVHVSKLLATLCVNSLKHTERVDLDDFVKTTIMKFRLVLTVLSFLPLMVKG